MSSYIITHQLKTTKFLRMMRMPLINELKTSLNAFLGWDKRRIDCLAKILVALIMVQTTNLKKIACALLSANSSTESNYRRLQRFFSGFRMDYNAVARLIAHLFKLTIGQHYLLLDRTNWQWGKSNINVLFLCVAYKKIAIPIFWLVLNKKGNSSTRERAALVQRFIKVFGKAPIAGILGDREFIGKKWFQYLKNEEIRFIFRIKKDADTSNANGKSISVHWLFMQLPLREMLIVKGKRKIYGHQLYVVGMRIDDDYLIVVTNESPIDAIEVYGIRWEIETLFGCLKTKGFNFEDTHIVHRDRIKRLIVVLALAFCWSHLTGEWRHQHEKVIRFKKHGRPQNNFFRYGLDWLLAALLQRGQKLRKLSMVFKEIIGNKLQKPPGGLAA